jgi:hypothetical protein
LIKVNLVVEYNKNGYDDYFVLSFFTLRGIIKLKYEIPLLDIHKDGIKLNRIKKANKKEKVKKKEDKKFSFIGMYESFKSMNDFYSINRETVCKVKDYIKKKLIMREFKLDVVAGTGDSFYTGILGGALWAIAGILLSFLANNTKSFKRHLNIKSDFSEKKLNVDLYCIFTIKIVHIIVVSLILFFHRKSKNKEVKQRAGGGLNV